MNLQVLHKNKQELELQLDSITVAEVLRVYLVESGAAFAAWRREHPSKPVILKVTSNEGNVTNLMSNAIAALKKDTSKLIALVKK